MIEEKELPEGWEWKEISALINKVNKVDPKKSVDAYTFKYVDISSIDSKTHRISNSGIVESTIAPSRARQLLETGDIVFSTVRPYLRRIALVDEEHHNQIASTGFSVLRGNQKVENRLLFYYLISDLFLNLITPLQRGASYPAVRNSDVMSQLFPLPPLPVQKRIVSKLDVLFGHLEVLKEKLAGIPKLIEEFRQSVLTQAVTGKLTEDWRVGKELGEWEEKVLKDIIKTDVGFAFKSSEYKENGIKLLRGQNIAPGSLRWKDAKFFDETELQKYKHLYLKKNEVILAMDRPIISTGLKVAIVKESDLPCVLVQRVTRFQSSVFIDSKFLYYIINSQKYINHLFGEQTGTQIPHISSKQILEYQTGIPSVEEQTEIVRRVESLFAKVDVMEARYEVLKGMIDDLPQAVLGKAFRGELV